MPRPPNPAVRDALLSAGIELIHSRGFNASGVKDFTAAAGVPKGSFYNYFASKESFVVAVLEQYWQSIEDTYGPLLSDEEHDPLDRIVAFFRAMANDNEVRNFAFGCLLGDMALELASSSDEARMKLAELLGRWERGLTDCLAQAVARGDLAADRDLDELAATLIEAWEGAVMRSKVEQGRGPYRRFETVVVPRLLS